MNFFATHLEKEKDDLVKYILSISLNNYILDCEKYVKTKKRCYQKYKYFFDIAKKIKINRAICDISRFYDEDLGYIEYCAVSTPDHFEELINALKHSQIITRVEAIKCLGKLGLKKAVRHLESLLHQGENSSIKYQILASLVNIEWDNIKWYKTLYDMYVNNELTHAQKKEFLRIKEKKEKEKYFMDVENEIRNGRVRKSMKENTINIGILTACDVEHKAVKDYFSMKLIVDNSGNPCWIKENCPLGFDVKINLIHYWGVEGSKISNFLHQIEKNWSINCLFLLGIAGGISKNNVLIGDIVISDQIIDVSHKKIEGVKDKFDFELRPVYMPINKKLIRHFVNFQDEKVWFNNEKLRISESQKEAIFNSNINGLISKIKEKDELIPEVRIGIYFSGNEIVKSKAYIEQLLNEASSKYDQKKCYAIEIESGSLYAAMDFSNMNFPFVVIKGISDVVEQEEDSLFKKFHELAANRSVYYFKYFIEKSTLIPGLMKELGLLKETKSNVEVPLRFAKSKFSGSFDFPIEKDD